MHVCVECTGYAQQWYAWECMVMLRKFVLVCVAVLLANAQDGLQIYAGMGVVRTRRGATQVHLVATPC